MSDGENIAKRGWCAGAVFAKESIASIQRYLNSQVDDPALGVGPHDWLVVVSQTCDVVAKTMEQEPYVEALHCRVIDKPRTQYRALRSTRIIDFWPNQSTYGRSIALSAHATRDRHIIPRRALLEHSPDSERRLDPNSTRKIRDWYSLRNSRPAWPNNFAKRVALARVGMEEALSLLTDEIEEVRIAITDTDRELDDGVAYRVAVYFVIDQQEWENNYDERMKVFEAYARFVSALDACEGIEVDKEFSRVTSGEDFSWQESKSTDLWNFAHLSNQDP